MKSPRISALTALGILVLFAMALTGCDGGGNNSVANVRVFNGLIGTAGAGGVNVSLRNVGAVPVNGAVVPFGQVSSLHRASSDDAQNTYLFLANSATPLSTQKFDYPSDNTSANTTGELLVATGVTGQSGSAPQLIYVRTSVPLGLIRNNGQPTANALLRVVNAAPGLTNNLSIYNDAGTTPVVIGDLSNIAFGAYSSGGNTSSNYTTLLGATYALSARDTQGNLLVSLSGEKLQPGFAYTLIVYGSTNAAYGAPVAAALIQDYPSI